MWTAGRSAGAHNRICDTIIKPLADILPGFFALTALRRRLGVRPSRCTALIATAWSEDDGGTHIPVYVSCTNIIPTHKESARGLNYIPTTAKGYNHFLRMRVSRRFTASPRAKKPRSAVAEAIALRMCAVNGTL